MKGDKGICIFGEAPYDIRKTKYDSQKHAQEALEIHLSLGVIPKSSIVYKCKVCKMWHFGIEEISGILGKK